MASDAGSATLTSNRPEPPAPTFDELYGLFEQLQKSFPTFDFGAEVATLSTTRDAGVGTEPRVMAAVSTETDVVATRSVVVGGAAPFDGATCVRGYERALELPSQTPIALLYGVFRRSPGYSAEELARRLTMSSVLGHPLAGDEHELVEFALRVMAVVEKFLAGEIRNLFRLAELHREPVIIRQAFTQFYSSLTARDERSAEGADREFDLNDDPYF